MTLLEMRDKRALLITDNAELTVKIEKEKRKLDETEQKLFDDNLAKIAQLEKDILVEEELRKVPAQKVEPKMEAKEKRFSLMNLLRSEMERSPFDSDFTPVITEGRESFKRAGVSAEGNIVLPFETRAAIVTGQTTGTTAGGYAIGKDWKNVLPPLTNYLVLTKAGASYLTGLVGDVRIPTYSGTTVLWKAEVASASDGAGTWGYVDLAPKRLTAYLDVSKMFLLQDSVGAEQMLMENIAKAISVKLEETILGNEAGSATSKPEGLFYDHALTATATSTSFAAMVNLESAVNAQNALFGSLAYITNAAGAGLLKQTAKVSSSDSVMIMENGQVNGYPVYISNGVASGSDFTTTGYGIIFGNWNDLYIGQWGGYDILVDPYTQAALGTVRIVVNSYFDADVARGKTVSFEAAKIK